MMNSQCVKCFCIKDIWDEVVYVSSRKDTDFPGSLWYQHLLSKRQYVEKEKDQWSYSQVVPAMFELNYG